MAIRGKCRSEACGDSPSCEPESMLKNFAREHSDLVDLKVADYSSLDSILASLEDLNRVLEGDSADLRVSPENIELLFSRIAPIIAVNDVLTFVGEAPSEAQLF